MIKVVERHAIRRKQIYCEYCGSLLEYGNEDLEVNHQQELIFDITTSFLECPVCRCRFPAPILKPKSNEKEE
jgi:hypothetical protein